MFTIEEMHRLKQELFERMLKAGWLKEFKYTDGKGWWPTLTVSGVEKFACLGKISETYGLLNGDACPLVFSKLAHGEDLPAGFTLAMEPEPLLLRFFKDCVDELGIHDNEDLLLMLVVEVSA